MIIWLICCVWWSNCKVCYSVLCCFVMIFCLMLGKVIIGYLRVCLMVCWNRCWRMCCFMLFLIVGIWFWRSRVIMRIGRWWMVSCILMKWWRIRLFCLIVLVCGCCFIFLFRSIFLVWFVIGWMCLWRRLGWFGVGVRNWRRK